tara:strand:- start:90 stop:632 length:543 start_codon:yes stop_codon:yes gene_type:complete
MALSDKKYEKFYNTTGSGSDKVLTAKLTEISDAWDVDKAEGCVKYLADPILGPLIFQMQQMQDEITALRTEISTNKDKATFPGLGTSGSTALAGNTTVISSGQASAITANTAKTGISTGQASAITANTAKVSLVGGTGTALSFSEMITVPPGKKGQAPTYRIVMTAVKSGVSKSVTLTLT